jgi:ligand-binding sensor domain-containing protein/signal transduction histidine kinase
MRKNLKIAAVKFFVKFLILVTGVVLTTFSNLQSQEERIDFEHFMLESGLSSSTIHCIFQDNQGFLWLGTSNGLNKYDGYNFKTYRYQPENPNSLSENVVRTIIQDRAGNLWIGTFGGGVNRFDPRTETFKHYRNIPGKPNSLRNNFVFSILEDRAGMLWIGTFAGGLDRFDPRTGTFKNYLDIPGDPTSLSGNVVRTIYEDRAGILWIGTLGGGLNKFSPKTGTFTHYMADPTNPNRLSNNFVATILEDQDHAGILWIGTSGGGLNKFDTKTGTFTHFPADPGNPKSLSSNDIRKIYLDQTGVLWVGTVSGLDRFDRKKKEFIRYLEDSTDPGSLSDNSIRSIYEDRSGVIWIGTEFGGLNKFNRMKKKFYHYYHVSNDSNSLSDNTVTAIYQDRSGIVWIGTYGGLNKWDRKNEIFTPYQNNPRDPTSLSENKVWSIYEDRSGELWIGTLGGLNYFDRKNETFTRYLADPNNPNSLSDNRIMSIAEDRRGFLWLGTFNGLNRFDPVNKKFKHYQIIAGEHPGSSSHNTIISLFEDRHGGLWIGTLEGLNKFNPETDTFTRYRADPGNRRSLSSDIINVIYEDHGGILWIGTHGGLNKYERKADAFTHYRMKAGLPSDMILGILEDDHGNLWICTDNGLSKFNPGTGQFKNYDSSDGLQGNEFRNGCCKSKSGEMFFGGVNGFNAFFPDSIIDNPYPPNVVITDFKISNKSVAIGEEVEGRVILEKHISETSEINLSYKDTTLSFEYVGLHYEAPGSNLYAYKMEGLEKDWNYVGNRRFAIYPHLHPGHYVFKVKASNNDNVWNETGASINIDIPPPYWQEWWFRVLLGAIFISMLFGGYFYRTRQLRKRLVEQQRVQVLLKQSRDEMKKSRDIAEFRSAENEKLIAAISSIFITVAADGKISQWNDSAEKFFNLPKARVKERLFVDILKEYVPGYKLREIIEMAQHQDKAVNNIEIQVDFPGNKELKQLLATINPIMDTGGKNFGFLFLAEDITHRKKEQMQVLVSQKLEALGQMASGIAHEIRSPLQYIGDNVRFLLENFDSLMESCAEIKDSIKKAVESGENVDTGKLNRRLREKDFDFFIDEMPLALDHIINGVSRVSHIVKSMTEFSHIGKDAYEKSDLNEMLQTTLVVAHTRIKNAADLQTDFAPGLPPLYCCTGELNQVFLNLLINAVDAVAETGKHGLIKVSTKRKDNELIVEISDNGIGIPDEIKDKIFAPFFTTKKVGYGTGQGLPFSQSIVVEKHKGKIYFKSKVNEGTTFFVHLPIADEPEEPCY